MGNVFSKVTEAFVAKTDPGLALSRVQESAVPQALSNGSTFTVAHKKWCSFIIPSLSVGSSYLDSKLFESNSFLSS